MRIKEIHFGQVIPIGDAKFFLSVILIFRGPIPRRQGAEPFQGWEGRDENIRPDRGWVALGAGMATRPGTRR